VIDRRTTSRWSAERLAAGLNGMEIALVDIAERQGAITELNLPIA
jgi:hypothetical protein